jgi:hypothetical protein
MLAGSVCEARIGVDAAPVNRLNPFSKLLQSR